MNITIHFINLLMMKRQIIGRIGFAAEVGFRIRELAGFSECLVPSPRRLAF